MANETAAKKRNKVSPARGRAAYIKAELDAFVANQRHQVQQQLAEAKERKRLRDVYGASKPRDPEAA